MVTVTVPLGAFTLEGMKMLAVLKGDMGRQEIQIRLGLSDEKHFQESHQQPGISLGLIEMTIADKPRSRLQKCRLTDKGRKLMERQWKDKKK